MEDEEIDAVVIATRHDSHAVLVSEAVRRGKYVFVEKPLALTMEQLDLVAKSLAKYGEKVLVGFNRRFSPFSVAARKWIGEDVSPVFAQCRVNAPRLPRDSWVYHPSEGGGRVLGEVCHFIDLLCFFAGSLPVEVSGSSLGAGGQVDEDNTSFSFLFSDGSIGHATYLTIGNRRISRERVEIFGSGKGCVIDNFRSLKCVGPTRTRRMRRLNVDRGHRAELAYFVRAVADGSPLKPEAVVSLGVTLATIRAREALYAGEPLTVGIPETWGFRV
jgi:predicted dehydrogenase